VNRIQSVSCRVDNKGRVKQNRGCDNTIACANPTVWEASGRTGA
jgi:hypothetical protein